VSAPISIREVAAHAGVSVGTVSNVLNRPDIVAQHTRDRVNAAIKALGFVRNESARQLRAGRSRTIGLVVLDVANPFFTDVARGVEDEASMSGLSVILCNSDEQLPKETRYLELLEEHRVQGILITPVAGADERLARLQRRGTPVILVDSRSPSGSQCSVAVDDVLGGDVALSHLLDGGHERIAFVGGPLSLRQVADRLEGATRALQRAGGTADDLLMIETAALNVSAGQRAGAAIAGLSARERPTAVFCANDLVALGLLQEMTRYRIRVPDDLAIVGYDDIEFAAAAAVPLSSVRQPRHQIGRTAAQLLLEESLGTDGHQHREVIFQPERGTRRVRMLSMRIALFVTCLADTLFPDVGKSTTVLLERLGHQVAFPEAQTCCGQMHVNTGYQREALPLIRRYVETFEPYDVIVAPSGSCVGSVRHQHAMVARRCGDPGLADRAEAVARRTFELSQLLIDVLGVEDVGAYYPHRVTYHPTCHSLRLLQAGDRPVRLLRQVAGLELVDLPDAEVCCGFGGTFAIKNADTSTAMLADKMRSVLDTRAEVCTAGDSSCLMHIGGGLSRLRAGVRTVHLAEILAATRDGSPTG